MSSITKPLTYLNQRSSKQPNYQCDGCSCRTRSHFISCDNGDVYNVDTSGFIWYLGNGSLEWTKIYKCRNYIPWLPYISRLDTIARDDEGKPAVYYSGGLSSIQQNKRIPVGRPCSGNFCGFQTDINSCVLFKNGQKVYEGKYYSDIVGSVGFGNVSGLDTYTYSTSFSNNYITDEGCDNNIPTGNTDHLVRDTNGRYDPNWNFTPDTNLIYGDKSVSFKSIVIGDPEGDPIEDFGWKVGIGIGTDCPVTTQTGFHLGTNDNGSVVWFTREPVGELKYKYAGTATALPEIWEIADWIVTDEFGVVCDRKLQDYDVIELNGICYALIDFQWVNLNKSWNQLFIEKGTACIFSDNCAPISSCDDTPDCTIINAKSMQVCGDMILCNANTNYPRVLLSGKDIVATFPASNTTNDSIECFLSQYYYTAAEDLPINWKCADNDGIALITIGNTQYAAYGHPGSWTITDSWTDAIYHGMNVSNSSGNNAHCMAIRQDVTNGFNIRLYYRGGRVADYFYNPEWYANSQLWAGSTGSVGDCELVYQCPDPQGGQLVSMWSDDGSMACQDITWILPYQVYYINKRDANGALLSPYTRVTKSVTYNTYETTYYCTSTQKGTVTITGVLQYIKCYHINGTVLYDSVVYTVTTPNSVSNHPLLRTSIIGATCTPPSCTCNDSGYYFRCNLQGMLGFIANETIYDGRTVGNGYMYTFLLEEPALTEELPQYSEGDCTKHYAGCVSISMSHTLFILRRFGSRWESYTKTIGFNGSHQVGLSTTACQNNECVRVFDDVSIPMPNVAVGDSCQIMECGANAASRQPVDIITYKTFTCTPTGDSCTANGDKIVTHIDNVLEATTKYISVSGDTWIGQMYLLEVEYCEGEYNPDYEPCPATESCPSKYITHVITVESKIIREYPFVLGDLVNYDHSTSTVEVEDACEAESPYTACNDTAIRNAYLNTLYYKACQNNISTYPICGYTLNYRSTTDTGLWDLTFNGNPVYTSPDPAVGTATFAYCCSSANALVIHETIGDNNRFLYLVEGNLIWSTMYLDSNTNPDTIQTVSCCADNAGNRYAFFRINMLREDLVNYNGEMFQGTSDMDDESLYQAAMAAAAGYTITLTDGTIATPIDCQTVVELLPSGDMKATALYNRYQTSDGINTLPDGTPFEGLYHKYSKGAGYFGADPIQDAINLAKKTVTETGTGRQSIITCNGIAIASNKNYEGIYCCGNFMFATFIDNEYQSGWLNYVNNDGLVSIIDQKHNPFPNLGDSLPPTLEDQESFKEFIAVWSDYKVDVFYAGQVMGTFACNDFQAPVHYDHLFTADFWVTMAIRSGQMNIGYSPYALEAGPVCTETAVIPFQNTLTTINANGTTTKDFNSGCM